MKNITSFCFLIWLPICSSFSQTPVKEYVDKYFVETSAEKAEYYRFVTRNAANKLTDSVNCFYMNGQPQMKGYYANGLREGVFIYFYNNGQIESKGNFNGNKEMGNWEYWYYNGQKKEQGTFKQTPAQSNEQTNVIYIIREFWDSTGTHLLIDGTGTWLSMYKDGKLKIKGRYINSKKEGEWIGYFENGNLFFKEIYKYGELIEGISYSKEGKEFIYNAENAEKMPEPIGGYTTFYQYIMHNLQYPKDARRKGIQGKVYVKFVIDQDGNIDSVEVLKGIGGGCDEEAARVVKGSPKWYNGIQRGQPVRVVLTVPIIFKLG